MTNPSPSWMHPWTIFLNENLVSYIKQLLLMALYCSSCFHIVMKFANKLGLNLIVETAT